MTKISIKELEDKLDDTTIRILELMNEHVLCKTNLENYLKSGSLDLAKTRYIRGNRDISSLQLPTEDATGVLASFKITTDETEEEWTKYKKLENDESVITQRNNAESCKTKGEEVNNFATDPMKWFGVLVPQSLRQAKLAFERCLDIVIENANVQSELQNAMKTYSQLRAEIKTISEIEVE